MRITVLFLLVIVFFFACNDEPEEDFKDNLIKNKIEYRKNIKNCNSIISNKLLNENNFTLAELNQKGLHLLEQGKYETIFHKKDSLFCLSLIYFNRILKEDSSFFPAYINTADVYEERGEFIKAIDILSDSRKIRPLYPNATLRLGILHEKLGKDTLAFDYYREAEKEYIKYTESKYYSVADDINSIFVYFLLEGKDNAIKRLEEKYKDNPNNEYYIELVEEYKDFNREKYIENY
jgi:tetratricopeptide (TPR) repeat protein